MAKAAKRKPKEDAEPLLGGAKPTPHRKLNASVIPVASAIADASINKTPPLKAPRGGNNVVSLHKHRVKTRFDFQSETEYELYLLYRKMQEKEQSDANALLQEVRAGAELKEIPAPDLPVPAAASSPVHKDESLHLAAYLAHHNPMGATRAIPTKEGDVVLKDGTVIRVNKRQDLVDPDEECLPYGGFEYDGQCFVLSWQRDKDGRLSKDRKLAEHISRRSQNCRQRLGKTTKTAYQNVATIQEYRPVPDVQWFLRNPDGKSHLRGDLNPYPPGIVPVGDELASHIELKKEHSRKVEAFMNFNAWSKRTCDNMLKSVSEPQEVSDWVCRNMQAHDWRDQAVMQERMQGKWDDVPWSYAEDGEAANDSDQVSPVQGSDATETTPQPEHSQPSQLGTTLKYIGKPDAFEWAWPSAKEVETERDAEEPSALSSVVFVRPDGIAMKVDGVHKEHYHEIARQVGSMQPHAGESKAEGNDQYRRVSLDLRDRRAAATLRILERRIRMEIAELTDHLETVVQSRWLAEAYQKTGTFEIENVSEFMQAHDIEMVIEPVPYDPPKPVARRGPVAQYWPTPKGVKAKFARIMRLSDELQVGRDDRHRRERRALKLYKAELPRLRALERKALAQMGAKIRMRRKAGTLEQMQTQLYLLTKHIEQMKALERELGRLKALIPEEKVFLQKLGAMQPSHTSRVLNWTVRDFNRRTLRRWKYKLNLGRKKERPVQPVAPSTVPERPVNEPVEAVFTPLPALVPPPPKPIEVAQSPIITPKVEVITFDNDPVMGSLRRAHIQRLIASGKFKPEELKQHDKEVFSTLVA